MASAVLRAEKEELLPIADLILLCLLCCASVILTGAHEKRLPASARLFVSLARLKKERGCITPPWQINCASVRRAIEMRADIKTYRRERINRTANAKINVSIFNCH